MVRSNGLVDTSPGDPWLGAGDTKKPVVGFTYKVTQHQGREPYVRGLSSISMYIVRSLLMQLHLNIWADAREWFSGKRFGRERIWS